MTIETAMLAHLLASAVLNGLVANRISPPPAPQGQPAPFITYQRISRVTPLTHTGETGPSQARIQVDSWAKTYLEAKTVADAAEAAMRSFVGDQAGRIVFVTRYADRDEDLFEEAPVNLHRVSRDYFVSYRDED